MPMGGLIGGKYEDSLYHQAFQGQLHWWDSGNLPAIWNNSERHSAYGGNGYPLYYQPSGICRREYTVADFPNVCRRDSGWRSFTIIVIPSSYTFLNQQMWENNNPMRLYLQKMEANQKKIMKELGIEYEE